MNTDDLIDFLATRVEPVDPHRQDRQALAALLMSFAAATAAVIVALGLRADLMEAMVSAGFAMKIGFLVTLVAIALWGLRKGARAGAADPVPLGLLCVPLVLLWMLGALELARLPLASWRATVLFYEWPVCLLSIPLLSALPLVALTLVVREGAPTHLRYCGALTGLCAGGLGALAYAAYCLNDTPVYVGVWYVAGIAAVTAFGWLMGPRMLRW
ncbi:MAG: hypothetical protein B7Y12_11660 [Rhizobiales bacterium 24-66-13]|jgi:hypothetical protein|uniref:NrsF family protein n=1 Tax=Roseixanthobacter finlandensis TaxID=3119922 RepID=UPI000BCC7400|nr:MAG: hypothetical protein B7Y61_07935 [Rhizobiales bacterium 35-66-30]OYZ76243.1 MAG: hypothetical protein B7Y12_11660 [Rhizobiales bacterium 24-66-13]OZA98771.1 MAG: hypothetical protein B7X67_21665 [Rhizobiales bacterium 39-66-18]HQS07829.1 DUF1109 domain-containing protein [Xanthobacteraceae bacterium]HQS49375.1 DUF1109 domain-containing protein [Xanthobacteraceae bacterium]